MKRLRNGVDGIGKMWKKAPRALICLVLVFAGFLICEALVSEGVISPLVKLAIEAPVALLAFVLYQKSA